MQRTKGGKWVQINRQYANFIRYFNLKHNLALNMNIILWGEDNHQKKIIKGGTL